MRRLLCLLLVLAACKSSTKKEAERKDRLAVVTAYVLEGSTSDNAFHREQFHGDVDHIAETESRETHMSDSYVKKDTVLRNYIFKEGQLYQVAGRSSRMHHDTVTMRYDTAGRVLARVHSDDRATYSSNVYVYNHAGRLSKTVYRLFSIGDTTIYKYNESGDTISIESPVNRKRICIVAEGDGMTVRHDVVEYPRFKLDYMETYNSDHLQTTFTHFVGGGVFYKVFRKYDKHNNPVSWEYHRGNQKVKGGVDPVDPSRSYKVAYEYDSKGNWTSKAQTWYDTSKVIVIKRKITYR